MHTFKENQKHWHPLLDAVIRIGGLKPVKDKNTGLLADEYQPFRYMPGLLNNRGIALDEIARIILEEFPICGMFFADGQKSNLYPEELRNALEFAICQARREELEEIGPPDSYMDRVHMAALGELYEREEND